MYMYTLTPLKLHCEQNLHLHPQLPHGLSTFPPPLLPLVCRRQQHQQQQGQQQQQQQQLQLQAQGHLHVPSGQPLLATSTEKPFCQLCYLVSMLIGPQLHQTPLNSLIAVLCM